MSAEIAIAEVETSPVSPGHRTMRRFFTGWEGKLAVGVCGLLILVGVFGPLVFPEPGSVGTNPPLTPPSLQHPFGTDSLGRDTLTEVVWGTRLSLIIALFAGSISVIIGAILGILAAYVKLLDPAITMLTDIMLAMPVLPFMIVITSMVGPSVRTMIVVLGAFSWPPIARLIRSNSLAVVQQPYIDSARAINASPLRIMFKHVLPIVSPLLIVNGLLAAARSVIGEAGLSFLGLGDPDSWSWGRIIFEAQRDSVIVYAWWQTFFPSLMILLLVVSATIVGIRYNDSRGIRL